MFIRLTSNGKPLYLNENQIVAFYDSSETEKIMHHFNTVIHTTDAIFNVAESIEELLRYIRPVNIYCLPMCEVNEEKLPLDTALEDLGLSKRAENILSKLGVQTLGDISDALNPKNHKFVRGLGSVTMTEIIQKYQACGYKFDWLP